MELRAETSPWPPRFGSTNGAFPGTLKAFLKERRARITPQSFGLPAKTAGRTSGLRREDVAELMNVSTLWYALFESGTSRRRFSSAFLNRVAEILSLDEADREILFRLVTASGCAAPDVCNAWNERRWHLYMREVADTTRALARDVDAASATSFACARIRELFASAVPGITFFCLDDDDLNVVHYEGRFDNATRIGRRLSPADSHRLLHVASQEASGARDWSAAATRAAGGLEMQIIARLSDSARSAMLVPVAGDKLIGLLLIDSPFAHAFLEREYEIAEIVATQLGHSLCGAAATLRSRTHVCA